MGEHPNGRDAVQNLAQRVVDQARQQGGRWEGKPVSESEARRIGERMGKAAVREAEGRREEQRSRGLLREPSAPVRVAGEPGAPSPKAPRGTFGWGDGRGDVDSRSRSKQEDPQDRGLGLRAGRASEKHARDMHREAMRRSSLPGYIDPDAPKGRPR